MTEIWFRIIVFFQFLGRTQEPSNADERQSERFRQFHLRGIKVLSIVVGTLSYSAPPDVSVRGSFVRDAN